jgi:hypothetical protein
LNEGSQYEGLKSGTETAQGETKYNWQGHVDRMTMAEKLKDAYNERKTMRKDKVESKTRKFYKLTKPVRIALVLLSLGILVF